MKDRLTLEDRMFGIFGDLTPEEERDLRTFYEASKMRLAGKGDRWVAGKPIVCCLCGRRFKDVRHATEHWRAKHGPQAHPAPRQA
jgi:hypothetical protein